MKQVKREEMPGLKAFLHNDLVNEHSVGFSLNMGDPSLGEDVFRR
jgi:hypothetical protein